MSAGLPFRQAPTVLGTVISVTAPTRGAPGWAVADVGLKALGMDHGNPTVPGAQVRVCSDEHPAFTSEAPVAVGDRIPVLPAHVDPTVAMHDQMHLVHNDEVLETWSADLRGWGRSGAALARAAR